MKIDIQSSTTKQVKNTHEYQPNKNRMNDFLDLGVGSKLRQGVVENVEKTTVNTKDNETADKIVLSVNDGRRIFQVSDCWVEDHKQSKSIKGLWFTLDTKGQLSSGSTLAKVLAHYGVSSLKDLQGTSVNLYPDPKDFLVLTICDMAENITDSDELKEETGLFD